MFRLDDVAARIEAKVPALAGRIENAGQFAVLVERGQLPQVTPAAFVLPGGLSGGAVSALSGMFVQAFDETVSVVLVDRVAADPRGSRAIDGMTPLVRAVVDGLAGWGPDEAIGIFALQSGELVGSQAGTLIFQLDFILSDQLRIMP